MIDLDPNRLGQILVLNNYIWLAKHRSRNDQAQVLKDSIRICTDLLQHNKCVIKE